MTNNLKDGTFINWQDDTFGNMMGVFLTSRGVPLKISFEEGFPKGNEIYRNEQITPITDKNLFLANLEGIATALVRRAEDELFTKSNDTNSKLYSAFVSRQADYLMNLITTLKQVDNSELITQMLIDAPGETGTGTGIYVARGEYAGQGRSKHFAGLSISPRMPEEKASRYLSRKHRKGFFTIPGIVQDTISTSSGQLVGYTVLEIPKNKIDLVTISEKFVL